MARPSHVPPFVRPFNNMVRSFAGRYLYALLRHTGRKSGKSYSTPVVAWHVAGGIMVPVTWGTSSDWYQNITAAGGCEIQMGGRWYRCDSPRLIDREEARSLLPAPARLISTPFPIQQFMLLRRAAG